MKNVHVYGDFDQPTILIRNEQHFEVEDLECSECGFVKNENVAHALEAWWGANSDSPCYVEVCDCEDVE